MKQIKHKKPYEYFMGYTANVITVTLMEKGRDYFWQDYFPFRLKLLSRKAASKA